MPQLIFGSQSRQQPPTTGKTTDYPFTIVLASLHLKKATGVLHLGRDQTYYRIHFLKGVPIYVESGPASLMLGNFLLQLKKITQEEHEKSEKIRRNSGMMLGQVLVKVGTLTKEELGKALKLQIKYKLLDCFKPKEGMFLFQNSQLERKKGAYFPSNTENILWSGIKKYYDEELIKSQLNVNWEKLSLQPLDISEERIAKFNFSDAEKGLLSYFQSESSLAEILLAAPKQRNRIYQLLYTLYLCKMISILDPVAELEPDAEESKEAPEKTSEKKAASGKVHYIIDETYKLLKYLTPFELLGVSKDAPIDEIDASFEKWSKIYGPDVQAKLTDGEIRRKAAEIFELMSFYQMMLTDPEARQEWEERRQQDPEATESSPEIEAKAKFIQGLELVEREEFDAALELFEKAASLDPTNPRYFAWSGWSWYNSKRDYIYNKRTKAVENLIKAYETDSGFDMTYYFYGVIAKEEGREYYAYKLFQTAFDCNPQNHEAEEEIRQLRRRMKQTPDGKKNSKDPEGILAKLFRR